MEKNARALYNQSFTEEKYKQMLGMIHEEFPNQLDFRVAESPIFIDKSLKIKLLQAGNAIVDTLLSSDFKEKTARAIPSHQWVPNEGKHPHFLAIDFALTTHPESQEVEPQLIELQGFPSLFGYQWYLGQLYRQFFTVPDSCTPYFNKLDDSSYIQKFKDILLGDTDPKQIVLLEIEPEKQKTRLDFAITEQLWGIPTICLTKVIKRGRKLYYLSDNQEIEIKKIYNRVIFDDLDRNYPNLETSFKQTDDVDVEWLTHPNWFFRISKFLLPFLKGPYFPKTSFLSDLTELPSDLENFVLKPLFSFAGSGVIIDVTAEHIAAIKDPENYILQQKVAYSPLIEDNKGEKIKAEIRLLYIWGEKDARPTLLTNLARLSKGKMIGVDYNKNKDWVGGSCAFFERD